MRVRWMELSLTALLALLFLDQYPMWGTNDAVSVTFQVAYLLAGGGFLTLGAGLYLLGTRTGIVPGGLPSACLVFGAGLYVHYSLMVLAERGEALWYATTAAVTAGLILVGLILASNRAPVPQARAEDTAD